MRVNTSIQNHLREDGNVSGCRKQTRITCDSAHGPGVLIVNFALNQAFAIAQVILSGRNARATRTRRIEQRSFHSEWRKDFFSREFRQRFAREALDDFAEQDESKIGILDLLARLMNERFSHDQREDPIMSFGILIEITVCREAGIMKQEHSRGNASAPRRVWIILCGSAPLRQ